LKLNVHQTTVDDYDDGTTAVRNGSDIKKYDANSNLIAQK